MGMLIEASTCWKSVQNASSLGRNIFQHSGKSTNGLPRSVKLREIERLASVLRSLLEQSQHCHC